VAGSLQGFLTCFSEVDCHHKDILYGTFSVSTASDKIHVLVLVCHAKRFQNYELYISLSNKKLYLHGVHPVVYYNT
jgi:hypothetical protein